jgi:nucleoside-diphosphate-sugar epimerase
MKILVVGCGYVGRPLALLWQKEGHEITAWVHSPETAAALASDRFAGIVVGSVADEMIWRRLGRYDRVIHCASSGRGGPAAYREVFVEGIQAMVTHQPQARLLMVSSTSVYGQTQGEIVTEESAAEPSSETSRILREAEHIALRAEAIVVRSSGIYGPGRAVLFEKLRRGETVIEGDGSRWLNQIHQRDLVVALDRAMAAAQPGEIYNASDDESTTQHAFYAWCSEFLGVPMPPRGPINPARKRGLTNKRVANTRLRALGWRPVYPSFREGLAADHSPR